MPAAVNLLSRAASLLALDDPERAALLPDLAFAHLETGDFEGLQETAGEMSAAAEASGDPRLQGHAAILAMWIRLFTDPVGWAAAAQREADTARAAFGEVDDERGLAKACSLLGLVHTLRCHFAEAEAMYETAVDHARRAGDRRDEMESRAWVPLTIWAGPTHVDQGVERCRSVFERAEGDREGDVERRHGGGGVRRRPREVLDEGEGPARASPRPRAGGRTARVGGRASRSSTAGSSCSPAIRPAAERVLRSGYETLTAIGEIRMALHHRRAARGSGVRAGPARRGGRSSPERARSGPAWRMHTPRSGGAACGPRPPRPTGQAFRRRASRP